MNQRISTRTIETARARTGRKARGRDHNPYYSGPVSDHFDGVRFFNPGYPWAKKPADLVRALMLGPRTAWPTSYPSPFRDRPPARVSGARLRVTLIGHASFLIQTRDLNLLVDPVFAERASPLGFAGPKRVNAPGIAFEDLPPIDVVLVTHNHYDHLDIEALAKLNDRHAPRLVTPLGNDTIIRARVPAMRAEAHDWGAEVALSQDVVAHLVPTLHWSARGIGDRRKALWASFVLDTPDGAIYHVGDTAFGQGETFREAKARFPRIRLANLPIGAYEPRWFMKDQHIDPHEAVAAFRLLGAAYAAGHHWGTFRLTAEGIDHPVELLAAAREEHAIAPDTFRALRPGEVFEVPPLAGG